MTAPRDDHMVEITSPEEIPAFANENDEHAFWSTHCVGRAYLDKVGGWIAEERLPDPLPLKRNRRRAKTAKRP